MPHPDHLGELLTSKQIQDWIAFNEVSPIGGGRHDYLAALVCSTVAAAAGAKRAKIADFVPRWGIRRPQQMTAEQMKKVLRSLPRAKPKS